MIYILLALISPFLFYLVFLLIDHRLVITHIKGEKVGKPSDPKYSRISIMHIHIKMVVLAYLFARSKRLRIISGEVYHKVYSDPRIVKSIETAVQNEKFVLLELIFGPLLHIENYDLFRLALKYPDKIKLYQLNRRVEEHITHFVFFDGSEAIKVDDPHIRNAHPTYRTGYIFFQTDKDFSKAKKHQLERFNHLKDRKTTRQVDFSTPESFIKFLTKRTSKGTPTYFIKHNLTTDLRNTFGGKTLKKIHNMSHKNFDDYNYPDRFDIIALKGYLELKYSSKEI